MTEQEIKLLIKGITEQGKTDKKDILKDIKSMGYDKDILKKIEDTLKNMDLSIKEEIKEKKKDQKEKTSLRKIFAESQEEQKVFFKTKAGEHLKEGMANAMNTIQGHVDTVLGDTKTLLIDPVLNIGKTAFNAIADFEFEDGDTTTHTLLDKIFEKLDDMYKVDQKRLGLDKKEFLKDARTKDKSLKGEFSGLFEGVGLIGFLITSLGLTLGAFVRTLTLPFEVLMQFTGTLKPFVGMIVKFKEFISPFTEIIGGFVTKLPMFSKFLKAFSWGFSKAFIPLQILLSTIDFFKGFFGSSESTFLGKVKDGLKQVFLGFFEPFIEIGEWISDMITPITFPIYDFVGKMFDFINNVFEIGFEKFFSILQWTSDKITSIADFIETVFTTTVSAFERFFQTIMELPSKISDYLYNLLPAWLGGKTKKEREQEKKINEKLNRLQSEKKLWEEGVEFHKKDKNELFKTKGIKTDSGLALYGADAENVEYDKYRINTDSKIVENLQKRIEEQQWMMNNSKKSWSVGRMFSGIFNKILGNNVAKMQTGGLTRKEGLAYIHPNEIVGPVNTIIPQLVKEVMVNNANSLKESKIIEKTISSPSKGNVTVINNNTVNKQAPPTDIESMSLIMYNTSWGFA